MHRHYSRLSQVFEGHHCILHDFWTTVALPYEVPYGTIEQPHTLFPTGPPYEYDYWYTKARQPCLRDPGPSNHWARNFRNCLQCYQWDSWSQDRMDKCKASRNVYDSYNRSAAAATNDWLPWLVPRRTERQRTWNQDLMDQHTRMYRQRRGRYVRQWCTQSLTHEPWTRKPHNLPQERIVAVSTIRLTCNNTNMDFKHRPIFTIQVGRVLQSRGYGC